MKLVDRPPHYRQASAHDVCTDQTSDQPSRMQFNISDSDKFENSCDFECEKKVHARLGALPEEERYEDYYWPIEIGYAWIAGFRPYLFWQNTTNCFDRITNLTYLEIPKYTNKIYE